MLKSKTCKHCKKEYEYQGGVNLIVFCPHCKTFDYLECEFGYGPVVPCTVSVGSKEIGVITCQNSAQPGGQNEYRYDCDTYHFHGVLKHQYLEALHEARDITANFL
ncbi:MAG: hypothetical protein PHO10_04330 [Gemmiger sp.]|nr:hypothetical protein [Gemmiger sp.]